MSDLPTEEEFKRLLRGIHTHSWSGGAFEVIAKRSSSNASRKRYRTRLIKQMRHSKENSELAYRAYRDALVEIQEIRQRLQPYGSIDVMDLYEEFYNV